MSLGRNEIIERSVDSVSTIYAIVIALALEKSVETVITSNANGGPDLSFGALLTGAPAFVAFLFTILPFWHGMNRHLDRCYLEKASAVAHGALLFDISVFFIEAILLFVAAWSLRTGFVSFYCLGLLLAFDMIWDFISHKIHFPGEKSHLLNWAGINLGTGVLAAIIFALPLAQRSFVLMALAIVRTILDYWICRDFYFPRAGR
jgi:hypothetical protein